VAGGIGVSILPAHVALTVQDSLRILPIEDLTDEIRIVGAFDVNATNDKRDVFLHLLKEEAASRNLAADPEPVRFPPAGQEVSA
jgi:hypothetical protein